MFFCWWVCCYGAISSRVIGQIFESPVFRAIAAAGISKALFKHAFGQSSMRQVVSIFINLTTAGRLMERAEHMFYQAPVKAPSLFIHSESDPFCSTADVERVMVSWRHRDVNMSVQSREFQGSSDLGQ